MCASRPLVPRGSRTSRSWSTPTNAISGRLRYALGELATLPRAALVIEDRYSQVFTLDRIKPSVIADGLAELQVR